MVFCPAVATTLEVVVEGEELPSKNGSTCPIWKNMLEIMQKISKNATCPLAVHGKVTNLSRTRLNVSKQGL